MALSEQQLELWSRPPGSTLYQNSHTQVRNALTNSQNLRGKGYEVYLQGSYRNGTNIRGDSDVDVVVQLDDTYYFDVSQLSQEQQNLYEARRIPATYAWTDFKAHVIEALQSYFGASAVTIGDKSIKVAGNANRVSADVIACCQYRYYRQFATINQQYVEGLTFWTRGNTQIINYPKPHYENGVNKNQQTGEGFKQFVRIFKNINSRLVDLNVITDHMAPSYTVECLLYNVADAAFRYTSYRLCMSEILSTLQRSNLDDFTTVSEMHYLCRGNPWNVQDATSFINIVAGCL